MSRTSILLLLAGIAACASGPTRTSGFLGDYSGMKRHPTVKNAWVWYKPGGVDLREYDRVLFDKVEVRLNPDSTAGELGDEVLGKVAAAFDRIFRETVAPYYTVVEAPGPHVLRVRVAVTDVAPAGKDGVQVGRAAMEGELLDSRSGERLGAIVDRIEGSAEGREAPEEWRHVEGAFREWAQRLVDYMDSYRS